MESRLSNAVKDLLALSESELLYLDEVSDAQFRRKYGARDCLHGDEVSNALQEQLSEAQRPEGRGYGYENQAARLVLRLRPLASG